MSEQKPETEAGRLVGALAALRSADVLTQNEGVAAAIEIGAAAVPRLLALLKESGVNRAQVMYALAQIGDRRAESAFAEGLGDDDERVRAYAAQGLARMGHPRALTACLQTLNDAADQLHLDWTPSVEALSEMGLRAAPALLGLLTTEDEMTRLHCQRALQGVLARRYGFRPGHGYPTPEAAEQACAAWRDFGNYDYAADAATRAGAAARLREWFEAARK